VINLAYPSTIDDKFESFRTGLLANSGVQSVARSSRMPTGRLLDAMGSQIDKGDSLEPTKADIKFLRIDEGFFPTYDIKTTAGRNFSKAYGSDTSAYIINEAAVKALALKAPEDAIGKGFLYGGHKGQIVGVVNDFHFESLHQRILPMVFFMPSGTGGFGSISIKISGTNIPAALAHIENTWKQFLLETPFDYTFLDESYQQLYESELHQGTLFTIFACIAIFIACLGLFGLSAFAISQRIKEIGIRKVLGADVASIVGLLSKDFLKLVLIAAVIAFPVAWYGMHQWLEDFAYRIGIPWWLFVVAGVVAAVIAFATISLQTVKAARANPVKNLRTE
jgi:putative ABC transport system permease protein